MSGDGTDTAEMRGLRSTSVVGPAGVSAQAGRIRVAGWRRLWDLSPGRRLAWVTGLALSFLVLGVGLQAALLIVSYRQAEDDLRILESLSERDLATLGPTELDQAHEALNSLHRQVRTVDRATALPPGLEDVAGWLPWVGPRYATGRELIELGLLLSDSGARAAAIGHDALAAFEATGIENQTTPDQTTWLDVVSDQRDAIEQFRTSFRQAETISATLDRDLMPARVRVELERFDQLVADYEVDQLLSSEFPAALTVLGADRPARFLVLFLNPAELRPTGGFPGTMALVTLERGQLASYEIFDGHQLSNDYVDRRSEALPQPWPIQEYFPQDGLMLHDASWWADFPRSGAQIMAMYAESGWPAIDGVIAMQPAAVADLLQVTGPIMIEFEGETRLITPENVYDEIERQRRLIVEGVRPWDKSREVHKEALEVIGLAIIDRLKQADRASYVDAAQLLRDSADRRDVQFYHGDPAVQQVIERYGWSGRIDVDPAGRTLAVTLANVALAKTSQKTYVSSWITSDPSPDGRRSVTLTLQLTNTGTGEDEPFYDGFQRWWVEIHLPAGARLERVSEDAKPDPEAPNGGSYAVDLFPQEQKQLMVIFSLPDDEPFVWRRQPGLNPVELTQTNWECRASSIAFVTDDMLVDTRALCAR